MEEQEKNDIAKGFIIKNLMPCMEGVVKTCCNEECEELFTSNKDKTFDISTPTTKLFLTFTDSSAIKDEIIDG